MIIAVPPATPVIDPLEEPILATPVLELDHKPPPVPELRLCTAPAQMLVEPVITGGAEILMLITVLEVVVPSDI